MTKEQVAAMLDEFYSAARAVEQHAGAWECERADKARKALYDAFPAALTPAPHYHQNCATCTCREPV